MFIHLFQVSCMRFSVLLLVCLFIPSISHARRGPSSDKHNSLYLQGMVGKSFLTESDNVPSGLDEEEQKDITSTPYAAILGYRFRYFCLELGYVGLGETGYEIGDIYEEKHDASLVMAGVKWIWGWFDLKVGAAIVNDSITYTKGSGANADFAADPEKQDGSATGGYFGIGFNFDLWASTELIFDYTGYAWTVDEEQTIQINSTEDHTSSDISHSMAVLSVGLRTFF
jgi:hypothetical protein